MKQSLKSVLKQIGDEAAKHNMKVWVVGGFVRDRILGKNTYDIDICAEGNPAPLLDFCQKNYGAQITKFKDFGTARVHLSNGLKLDFVSCRGEVYEYSAALPKVFASDIKDDLKRRDFTCNAVALSLLPHEFFKEYDFFAGRKAIEQGYIKILYAKSFIDDPTRLFRAVRFAARFAWKIENETLKLFKSAVKEKRPALLSKKRISNEFIKILKEAAPYNALKMAENLGLLHFVFKGLKFNRKINLLKDYKNRIAFLALLQGKSGEDFISALQFDRQDCTLALELLKFYAAKAAPLKPLCAEKLKILKLFNPSLKTWQLRPVLLKAADIEPLGFKGPQIGIILKSLSKAQYKGKVKNRKAAFCFVKTFGR